MQDLSATCRKLVSFKTRETCGASPALFVDSALSLYDHYARRGS